MYPVELEIKDTTESNTSASYLDLRLSIGRDGQLHTSIYDKRDDFNFHITNFPFLSSNIPTSPAYGVFVSQPIRYARACSSYGCFILRATRLSNKLLEQGYARGGSLANIFGTDVRLESPNPYPFIYQAKWKTWPIHILPISKIDPIHILFLKIDPIHILFFKFYPFIYFLGEKDTPLIYFWCKNDTHSYTGRPEKYTPFQPHICIYLYNGSYPPVGIRHETLEIVIEEVLWSIRGFYQTIWSFPLTNVKWHSVNWPYTMTIPYW